MSPRLAPRDAVRPGQEVGGYRVEKPLGAGGFGRVYLARREGALYALKFLHLEHVGDWGWRELYLLLRHEFPRVVRLLSHFKWPSPRPEYLVLVMEYVPGPTLYQWARETNPSARALVRLLLPLGRTLEDVYAHGVFHRDLKGDNVLVRASDGEAVLVDFGAGALPHAPRATSGLAPANPRYRSPEAVAFFLRPDPRPGERYAHTATDELYALGVILYVLATDAYPFDGPLPELLADIRAGGPAHPSERNPRVPRALGDLCLDLLAHEPRDRVPDARTLCARLEALLHAFSGDPRWDLPLCYGWTTDARTTEDAPGLAPDDEPAWLRHWVNEKPRRGPRPPVRRRSTGALVALGLAAGLAVHGPPPSPVGWDTPDPMPWATSLHEVAPPRMPLEAAPSAAPVLVATPAPVTPVTTREAPLQMNRQTRSSRRTPLLVAVTAAATTACPGAQLRKDPPPQDCPPGAIEAMTQTLGLRIGEEKAVFMPGYVQGGSSDPMPVKEGPILIELVSDWDVDTLSNGTGGRTVIPWKSIFFGHLVFGEKRIYGRITKVTTPQGNSYPVCMELTGNKDESGLDNAAENGGFAIWPRSHLRSVRQLK